MAAIKDGAVDYLQKPVEPAVLSATIHRALRERDLRGQQEEFTFQSMVNILSDLVSQTIERVDPYTAGHGERVRKYCREIAGGLGLDRVTSERLELAADRIKVFDQAEHDVRRVETTVLIGDRRDIDDLISDEQARLEVVVQHEFHQETSCPPGAAGRRA